MVDLRRALHPARGLTQPVREGWFVATQLSPTAMPVANTISGRIIDIRRYVIPLGLYGQGASRERWELWIKTPDGAEKKHVAACRSMPARRGHHVVLALEAGTPVGLFNLTTRVRANFAQADPAPLYRPLDIAVPVGLLFASLFAAALVAPWLSLVAVPTAVLYIPLVVTTRWLWQHSMRGRVEKMLDRIEREASQPTPRRQS